MPLVHFDGINGFKSWISGVLTNLNLYTLSEVTFTTTGNIDDLDFSNASIIRMNNASDATIRGLLAGVPGQIVTIVSIGAGHVYLAHQNANSDPENRLINFASSGNTPLAKGSGTATYQYDGTTDRWRLIQHEQGDPIDIPYNSGDFTATGSMTWTVESGDLKYFAYILKGTTLQVAVRIELSSVGGTPDVALQVLIPAFTVLTLPAIELPARVNNNGTIEIGYFRDGGGNILQFLRPGAANWSASTNNTAVFMNYFFFIS